MSNILVPVESKPKYDVGDKVKWLGHAGIWEVTKVEWNKEKRKHRYELKKLTNTYVQEYEHRLQRVDIA